MFNVYVDEFTTSVDMFDDYYHRLSIIFPENNAFDKPIIDEIIVDRFKPHKHLLNMEEIQTFELPSINDSKSFVHQLFHMF